MQPLRAYLLIFSDAGCSSSLHRDLESLCEAWKPFSGKGDITGIIHIGFDRPETEEFAGCANKYKGKMLLSASAKWALTSTCECASLIAGTANNIPLFVALNGWGYEVPIEEIGLTRSITSEPVAEKALEAPDNPLLLRLVDELNLTPRPLNCLNAKGITLVGDLTQCSEDDLLRLPNFGRNSLREIKRVLATLGLSLGMSFNRKPTLKDAPVDWVLSQQPYPNTLLTDYKATDSLPSIILKGLSSLSSEQEKILRARMGVCSEPRTLQQISADMKVTRQRISQIEEKSAAKISRSNIWRDKLEVKLFQLLDDRADPLPFTGLPILDAWFCGIEQMREPFNYLLKHKRFLNKRYSLLQANGQLFISRLSQNEWNAAVKQAMQLLQSGVACRWSQSETRHRVGDLLGKVGGELRSELWSATEKFAKFYSPNISDEPVLVGYGNSAEALVEAVLMESDHPIHYSDIPQRVLELYGKSLDVRRAHSAAGKVALVFGKGFYGFAKHNPLSSKEMEFIRAETLGIIFQGSSDHQWSCAALTDILNERGLNFDGRLNEYSLNISLRDSSEVKYLGRNLWTQADSSPNKASYRLNISPAVASLLEDAGKPMSTLEIKNALRETRDISRAFQIFPNESIISVGIGLWGLIERDCPLSADERTQLIDILQKMLLKKNVGIHISEIIACLEGAFEPISRVKDPVLIFSVAQQSAAMQKSVGGYLFLSEWGEPRRLNQSQAILEALHQPAKRDLSTEEISKIASTILGREIPLVIVSRYLSVNARLDADTKCWSPLSADDYLEQVD
jgi:Bacterial RNA polymerase, alpha chain C terminal domain/Sigma-70, region 4